MHVHQIVMIKLCKLQSLASKFFYFKIYVLLDVKLKV